MAYTSFTLDGLEERFGIRNRRERLFGEITPVLFTVNYPILQLVEAKKQDIEIGVPQCAAQMVGARLFNKRRGQPIDVIYGCVTTDDDWLFLRLGPDGLIIDTRKFYLGNLGQLLGAFQIVFDYYRKILT